MIHPPPGLDMSGPARNSTRHWMARWPPCCSTTKARPTSKRYCAEIVETAFEQDGLRRVLADPERIEDWRVGAGIAETWLTDHRDCRFPWPDGRDERKRGSSLPGADLGGCPRTRKIIVFENLNLYKSIVYKIYFLKKVYSRTAS